MSIALRIQTVALVCFLTAPVFGHGLPSALTPFYYEVEDGTALVDDCFQCDRPTFLTPLRGGFVLKRLPVRRIGDFYQITEIALSGGGDDDRKLTVRGSGYYSILDDSTGSIALDLEINGVAVHLENNDAAPDADSPKIDVELREPPDTPHDPIDSVFSLRLVAAPDPDAVLYELVAGETQGHSGSFFTVACSVCTVLTRPIPIAGSFLLVPREVGGPNPIETWQVAAFEAWSISSADAPLHVSGSGLYSMGGEVALTQELELAVDIDDGDISTVLESGKVPLPEGTRFPDIEVVARGSDPENEITVLTLELVAGPSETPKSRAFRRGETNGDGGVDLADAVYVLAWLFSGGPKPGCLDAADATADGEINITDPVAILSYLFIGGLPPPHPGPRDCAEADLTLGCDDPGSCDDV